jgi:hypothetical protein
VIHENTTTSQRTTFGFVSDVFSGTRLNPRLSSSPASSTAAVFFLAGLGDDFSDSFNGHWLVRPIPEPGTAGILGLGIALLAYKRPSALARSGRP